jgi:hypothetical protein
MTTHAATAPSRVARALEREAAEDVFFGQVVTIWARWFVIGAAALCFIWTAAGTDQLGFRMVPIVALIAVNFYLHGRYVLGRPSNVLLIATASAADLVVITTITLVWADHPLVATGLASPFFVFYYPVLLSLAFVLPRKVTIAYTAITLAVYTAICLPDVSSVGAVKVLAARAVTLAAMGGLGTFYWRVQRERGRDARDEGAGVSRLWDRLGEL